MEKKKVLFVGADPYPPYQYVDDDGKTKGLDFEVIRDIIDKMGYDPIFIIKEWSVIEELLNNKRLDMVFQVTKTPEREKRYYFYEKLRDIIEVIITSKEDVLSFTSMEEFIKYIVGGNLKLGVMKGYRYGGPINSIPEENKIPYTSTREILDAVSSRQVDFGIIDLGILKYHVKKNREKYANIKVLENLRVIRPLYVVFNDPLLRDEFNKYLRLYKRQLYDTYSRKYL